MAQEAGTTPSGDPAQACLSRSPDTEDPAALVEIVLTCTDALKGSGIAPETRAQMLQRRGVAYRNARDLKNSSSDLREAEAAAPNSAPVQRMLAWTYRTMQMFPEADAALSRSLALDQHWQGYLSRCVVRADQQKYAEALQDCLSAGNLAENEDISFFTADAHVKLGQVKEAIPVLEKAIQGAHASARIYALLVDCYRREGKAQEAKRIEANGRKAFPDDPQLKRP